jgi:hypothetical protein
MGTGTKCGVRKDVGGLRVQGLGSRLGWGVNRNEDIAGAETKAEVGVPEKANRADASVASSSFRSVRYRKCA